MQLHYKKRSPYARKVRVFAIDKNIKLDLIEEDLSKKSEVLLKANPLAKIPLLVFPNGDTLSDSSVICEYLDNRNDSPILIPKEFNKRIEVLNLDLLANESASIYNDVIILDKDESNLYADSVYYDFEKQVYTVNMFSNNEHVKVKLIKWPLQKSKSLE